MARPKGSQNKVTGPAKAAIAAFIGAKAPEVEKLWSKVAKKDAARALDLFAKLAEYVVPKLGRTEMTGEDGGPIKVVEILSYKRPNAPAE